MRGTARSAQRGRRGLLLLALLANPGCSLLLSVDASQCSHDDDCARFGQMTCDTSAHVCVAIDPRGQTGQAVDAGLASASAVDGAVSCQASSGCFQCEPSSDLELLSACTDATCLPFDNKRLTHLNPDGSLTPLP